MTFRIDKHGQLRITDVQEISVSNAEPDTLILTQAQTQELLTTLLQVFYNIK